MKHFYAAANHEGWIKSMVEAVQSGIVTQEDMLKIVTNAADISRDYMTGIRPVDELGLAAQMFEMAEVVFKREEPIAEDGPTGYTE